MFVRIGRQCSHCFRPLEALAGPLGWDGALIDSYENAAIGELRMISHDEMHISYDVHKHCVSQ